MGLRIPACRGFPRSIRGNGIAVKSVILIYTSVMCVAKIRATNEVWETQRIQDLRP